jgi:exodeoxyribonuclease VII small subunit
VLSISFDEAQAELETLIERIETGQLGLEEAVKAYEHGVRLVKHCRGILSRTEQRFADLSAEMRETN